MIHATSNNGITTLESVRQVTEGQVVAMKANKSAVKELCRDFHVSHTLAGSEDGTTYSKLLKTFKQKIDIRKEVDELNATHNAFLEAVDKLLDIEKQKCRKKPIVFLVIPVFYDPE